MRSADVGSASCCTRQQSAPPEQSNNQTPTLATPKTFALMRKTCTHASCSGVSGDTASRAMARRAVPNGGTVASSDSRSPTSRPMRRACPSPMDVGNGALGGLRRTGGDREGAEQLLEDVHVGRLQQ